MSKVDLLLLLDHIPRGDTTLTRIVESWESQVGTWSTKSRQHIGDWVGSFVVKSGSPLRQGEFLCDRYRPL